MVLEALDAVGDDLDALPGRLAASHSPADAGAPPRLQIMTLHHAKGLEFDVVILPGLARSLKGDDPQLLEWMECEAAGAAPLGWLLAARGTRGNQEPAAEYIRRRRQKMAEEERKRKLYVAATRARRRLHLFAGLPIARDGVARPRALMPLAPLWPALEEQVRRQLQPMIEDAAVARAARAAAAAAPETQVAPALLRRMPEGWRPAAARAGVGWNAAAMPRPVESLTRLHHGAAALTRRIGTAVHAMLRLLALRGELQWQAAELERALRQAGVAPAALAAARARARQALQQTVADARGRWILAAHAEAHNEWPLTGLAGGALHRVVVDRSFVSDEDGQAVRWIIDYKSASHEGGDRESFLDRQEELYRPQLQLYAALAGGLETRPIRCGLYFPLLGAWREVGF
jgi:ATP-dependent exoDNAse (exonuclease V) beta subunit